MSEPQAQNQYETYEVKTKLIYYIEENETKELDKIYLISLHYNGFIKNHILFERNNKLYIHVGGSKFLKVWLDKNMNVLFSFVKSNDKFIEHHEIADIHIECLKFSYEYNPEKCGAGAGGVIVLIDFIRKKLLKIVIENRLHEIAEDRLGKRFDDLIAAISLLFARKYLVNRESETAEKSE